MSRVEDIHKRSVDQRREAQYKVLLDWDRGKISGEDCIEKIVELEKFLPLNPRIIHGSPDPSGQG